MLVQQMICNGETSLFISQLYSDLMANTQYETNTEQGKTYRNTIISLKEECICSIFGSYTTYNLYSTINTAEWDERAKLSEIAFNLSFGREQQSRIPKNLPYFLVYPA